MKKRSFIIGFIGIFLLIQPMNAQTWETTKRLTWNSGRSEYPVIRADSNDFIHLVWRDETPGNYEIFYKRSTDGGSSWTTKRLSWNSGDSATPNIAIDSSDQIHLVWSDNSMGNYEFYYRKSTNSGVTWDTVKRLTWNSGDSWLPDIAVDSSDRIHLVWYDGTPGNDEIHYRKSTDGGVTWGAAKRLTWNSGRSFTPDIAAGSGNTIHISWHDETPGNFEIFYRKSTDSGGIWGSAKRLSWNSGLSYAVEIAVDSSDFLHVIWSDNSPGNHEIYYKRTTNGGVNWTTKRLTFNSGDSKFPVFVFDTSDQLHLTWFNYIPGNSEIYHRKSTDGGVNWGSVKRLTWNSGISISPEIAADSSNRIHLVWSDDTLGNYEIYYKKGIQ